MSSPSLDIESVNISKGFLSGSLWRNREHKLLFKDRIKLRKKIDEYEPDCILLSHYYALCIYPIFRPLDRVFYWVHMDFFQPERKKTTNLFRYYKEYRRWHLDKKYFHRILDGKNLLVVNDELRVNYQPHIPNAHIYTLPNGVNEQKIRELANSQLGAKKRWDCIFVGRLSAEKQPEHAIRAFANSGLQGRMAIVGDGGMMSSLQALCQSLGVAERVDFLGWQSNPYQYIVQSCCLVLSSVTEGFGLVIAEALLLDVPVVAYDLNQGIRYQLDYSQLRRGLVESQNIEKLAIALADVAKNPYLISHQDKDRLSMEKMAKDFMAIIDVV